MALQRLPTLFHGSCLLFFWRVFASVCRGKKLVSIYRMVKLLLGRVESQLLELVEAVVVKQLGKGLI
jgi:hypothetical protein